MLEREIENPCNICHLYLWRCFFDVVCVLARKRAEKQKSRIHFIKKRKTGMRKEALEPFIGQKIIIRDLFGYVTEGVLESVDDNSVILTRGRKTVQKTAMATEYVSSFDLSEKADLKF